ncbi:MAG TPA: hypothetical protein VGD90_02935 [Sphingobacteriaceae bacterium]
MFNKLTAIILILMMQIATFASWVAYAGFELNREYITQVLCVNRSKPQLSCLGKCYLNKMQKKAEQQKESGRSLLKEFQMLALIEQSVSLRLNATEKAIYRFPTNNNGHLKGWPRSTFHPPGNRS